MRSPVLLVMASALLVACEPSGTTAPSATAAATVAPAPSASAAATAPAATATATAAPSATASAASSADPSAGSAIPTPDEWKGAPEVRVTGSSALGCETKRVREWLGVFCRKPNDSGGTAVKVTRKKFETLHKDGPAEQRKDVQLDSTEGNVSLVARYVEGTDVEATFTWTDKEKVLVLWWPVGKPEPLYLGTFK